VKKPSAYVDVPLMVVVAMPYLTAPFLPDFVYQSVPDSPPIAIVAASTSVAAWDTVSDQGYDVRPLNVVKLPRST
jgi:hypothetical protein